MGAIIDVNTKNFNAVLSPKPSSIVGTVMLDNIAIEEAIEKLTNIAKNELAFYKEQVFPLIKNTINSIVTVVEKESNVESQYPEIVVLQNTELIESIIELEKRPPESNSVSITLPGEINFKELSVEDTTRLGQLVSEHLKSKTTIELQEIYNKYIRYSVTDFSGIRNLSRLHNYADRLTVFCILYLLNNSLVQEGTFGKLSDYRHFIETLMYNLRDKIEKSERDRQIMLSNNEIAIGFPNYNTIVAESTLLTKFYQDGGEIEYLYGSIDDGRIPYDKIKSAEYKTRWANRLTSLQIENRDKVFKVTKKAYDKYLPLIEAEVYPDNKTDLFKAFRDNYLGHLGKAYYIDVPQVIEVFILDYLLGNRNARGFVNAMKEFKSNGLDSDSAAQLAEIDIIIKFLISQLDVQIDNPL